VQDQQFPQATSDETLATEARAARRRLHTNVLRTFVGAGLMGLGFLASGCPGPADLENPDDHMPSGGTMTGGGSGSNRRCSISRRRASSAD
jgi:hypothetical protein